MAATSAALALGGLAWAEGGGGLAWAEGGGGSPLVPAVALSSGSPGAGGSATGKTVPGATGAAGTVPPGRTPGPPGRRVRGRARREAVLRRLAGAEHVEAIVRRRGGWVTVDADRGKVTGFAAPGTQAAGEITLVRPDGVQVRATVTGATRFRGIAAGALVAGSQVVVVQSGGDALVVLVPPGRHATGQGGHAIRQGTVGA
ncbi:MAG: hypothetical protein ACRDYD_11325 [Acidimicrobiales bacterium]